MKWIKASERLPDLYPVNNSDKLHYKLDGVKVDGFFLHQRCFEYFDTTIDGYSTVEFEGFARVEWLDESPAQPNGDEVRDVAVNTMNAFLQDKPNNGLVFSVSNIRSIFNLLNQEEISFSRFVELLNERASRQPEVDALKKRVEELEGLLAIPMTETGVNHQCISFGVNSTSPRCYICGKPVVNY